MKRLSLASALIICAISASAQDTGKANVLDYMLLLKQLEITTRGLERTSRLTPVIPAEERSEIERQVGESRGIEQKTPTTRHQIGRQRLTPEEIEARGLKVRRNPGSQH